MLSPRWDQKGQDGGHKGLLKLCSYLYVYCVCNAHKKQTELQSHNCHLDFFYHTLRRTLIDVTKARSIGSKKVIKYMTHVKKGGGCLQVQWPSDNDKVCYLRNRLIVMGLACRTRSWGKCLLQIPSAQKFWFVGSRKKILMLWALPSGIFSCQKWGPPKHSWP